MKRKVTEEEALGAIEDGARKITDSHIEDLLQKEQEVQRKFKGLLGRFIDDGRILFEMVKDYWHKQYREIPWWTVAAAAATLLYVLNPMDLIPDFIPFLGLVDDVMVVSVCLYMLENDIARYLRWKNTRKTEEE